MEISRELFEEIIDYTEALLSYNCKIKLIRDNRTFTNYSKYESLSTFDEVALINRNSIKFSNLPYREDTSMTISDINYYGIDSFYGELHFDTEDASYIMKFEKKDWWVTLLNERADICSFSLLFPFFHIEIC